MFAKLALRNVKRQIGNYFIYFLTVTVTVALMFAIHNVIYSSQLQAYAESMREMKQGLIGLSVMIAFIVAFVLGYANTFMMRLRKREFGTYLTLGMTRRNILRIFVMETTVMGIAALVFGILIGLGLYQAMMAIMTRLMNLHLNFAAYSAKALYLTVILVLAMFVFASVTSAVYLKRVSIYDLIHGEKKVEKKVRYPRLWFFLMIVCAGLMIGSIFVFYREMKNAIAGSGASNGGTLGSLFLFAGALILFHIALARSVVNLMLKKRKFCSRGTNTFVLRQLSGRMRANSVMTGVLAFLITFAVIGANVSFAQKGSQKVTLEKSVPFDIMGEIMMDRPAPYTMEEAQEIIRQYTEIETVIPYQFYVDGTNEITSYTRWNTEGYRGLKDYFLPVSQFNALMSALGEPTLNLENQYYLIFNVTGTENISEEIFDVTLERNKMRCAFGGMSSQYPRIGFYYFFIVVPDKMVEGMQVDCEMAGINLAEEPYDASGLQKALSYSYTTENGRYTYDRCDFTLKEYEQIQQDGTNAILVVGALYMAAVFVFLAMAVLALKVLAGISEDRPKYAVLFQIGADEKDQKKALFEQIFFFFFLPFAVPILSGIPVGMICAEIMRLGGYPQLISQIYRNDIMIGAGLTVIYFLYFMATYLIARKNVIFYGQN